MDLLADVERDIMNTAKNLARLYQKKELIERLPEEIKEVGKSRLSWASMTTNENGEPILSITAYGGSATQLELEVLGAQFDKPVFDGSQGQFDVSGQYLGHKIKVYGVDKPAGCQITEYQENVTRYKATCAEGKEL